jgi:DNA-directed RNA polymerase subunit F
MVKPEIIKETPISMVELKEELESNQKKTGKLHFSAEKTLEYLNQFTKLDIKKTKDLKSKIEGLKVPRLKEEHIIKLMDTMPVSAEDIKTILHGYTVTISNENLKKLAEAIKEFK